MQRDQIGIGVGETDPAAIRNHLDYVVRHEEDKPVRPGKRSSTSYARPVAQGGAPANIGCSKPLGIDDTFGAPGEWAGDEIILLRVSWQQPKPVARPGSLPAIGDWLARHIDADHRKNRSPPIG